MELSNHNMASLFAQLGIKNSDDKIESFIASNLGIPKIKHLLILIFRAMAKRNFYTKLLCLILTEVKLLIA